MDEFHQLTDALAKGARAVGAEFTSIWFPIQIGLILVAVLISALAGALFRRRVNVETLAAGWPALPRRILQQIAENFGTIVFILLTASTRAAMEALTLPSRSYMIAVAAKLATAWIVIALTAGLIQNRLVYRIVAVWAWSLAALSILGLLEPTRALLDSVAINLGGVRLTPLLVLKTFILLLITLWAATAVSDFFDRRVRLAADLTPSIQVLLGKLIRFGLIALAIVIVLSTVGIDMSALAVFSGAVGVGVGFGLQKIVSNVVSGIILLADKSIKPGDVISVRDTFGWVVTMGARYTSVNTRDGREILIPNEDLVTHEVINWSYSNEQVRLEVRFGVSYESDPHAVKALAMAVAAGVPRVLKDPAPVCHLIGFGDSALDFCLRFWIVDPAEGLTNLRSDVLFGLWDAFKREGIDIPFPQRELRLRGPVNVAGENFSES
jgi:small-conductance mechanosensitive channel